MFDYILKKIQEAEVASRPFRHIYIEEIFEEDDFSKIVNDPYNSIESAECDEMLFNILENRGYKIVPFPGCTLDKHRYIRSRKGSTSLGHHETTEGEGIALRYAQGNSEMLDQVAAFFSSRIFHEVASAKLGFDLAGTIIDGGIQKYLDGYEISPHPDTRKKAFTFMVNINPNHRSEKEHHHTSYHCFKKERLYIKTFWENNPHIDRCFIPYDWCEVGYTQNKNNSLVMFCPDNDSLHSVRARYDHLRYQRTQIYGNVWHQENSATSFKEYTELDLINGLRPYQERSFLTLLRKKYGYRGRGLNLSRRKLY